MRTAMHIIVLLVLVFHVQQTVPQMVKCYGNFDLTNGACSIILGEVPFDDCCMNPSYGYQVKDSICKSCRRASWTTWSEWSACSVSCTEGVRQRRRACYGIGKCSDRKHVGNIQTKPCEDMSCCPENGSWSEWGAWQPCSVTCERGHNIRKRTCSNPPPTCGGVCEGSGEEVGSCDTQIVCPTHGGWAAWGNWGECAGTCTVEGGEAPQQQRHRTCTNPPPSYEPRGNNCPGSSTDTQHCRGLPFCSVNGNWGPWEAFSDCSVTCGVGHKAQQRKCDNPAPKYGGQFCIGENTKTSVCTIPVNCPVNGKWSEWSEWTKCESPNERTITCKNKEGLREKERVCEGRDYGGAHCDGEPIQFGRCYDIEGCVADKQIPRAMWEEWSEWSYCKPDCGESSKQTRTRECLPDISKYSNPFREMFSGKPNIDCQPLANTIETRSCLNLPPCAR